MRLPWYKRFPFHPFLMALYPIVALLEHNINQIKPSAAERSIFVSALASVLFYFIYWCIFRDRHKAAILCSVSVALFFSYGHVYGFLKQFNAIGLMLGRHRVLVPLWMVIFIIALRWVRKIGERRYLLTLIFNMIAFIALAIPMVQIVYFQRKSRLIEAQVLELPVDMGEVQRPEGIPPDVYLIILDAYLRDDILLEEYQYDNSQFIDALTELGFYVARCSMSNYSQTGLSMISICNMNYIQALTEGFDSARSALKGLFGHSRVRKIFETLGYSIVAFDTGFVWINLYDADYFFGPPRADSFHEILLHGGMNGFEKMVLDMSFAHVFIDVINLPDVIDRMLPDLEPPYNIYRERTLYVLDQLQYNRVPSIQGPKFVYAHLIAPHFPYVFDQDGEYVNDDEIVDRDAAYRDQLIYVNKRILEIISEIITNSDIQPIIILQGDHGRAKNRIEETVAILNAYYLPNYSGQELYPSISPVNTYRLIFDTYFSGDFGLLKDVSYYSTSVLPFDFELIPQFPADCEVLD